MILEPFPAPLPLFHELFSLSRERESPMSKQFLSKIMEYIGCFAITCFGHQEAHAQGWNPSFRIEGQVINHYIYDHICVITFLLQVFHRIGGLLPPEEVQPKFLQVYFLDTFAEQATVRGGRGLSQEILRNLTEWFHQNNTYNTLLSIIPTHLSFILSQAF